MSLNMLGAEFVGIKPRKYTLGAEASQYTDKPTVLAVQKALKATGKTSLDPGPLDGIWGDHTALAVRSLKIEGNQSDLGGGINDWVLAALGVSREMPSDGRPAKGWSQAQPDKMGPAVVPGSEQPNFLLRDAFWGLKVWQAALAGLGALLVGGGVVAAVRR